ncbi:MAG TPA: hypothetical protein VGG03_24285 [Thermoanaerobaculia bacterium]|jgi:hypothetical protein
MTEVEEPTADNSLTENTGNRTDRLMEDERGISPESVTAEAQFLEAGLPESPNDSANKSTRSQVINNNAPINEQDNIQGNQNNIRGDQNNIQGNQNNIGNIFVGFAAETTTERFEDPTQELPSKIAVPPFPLDRHQELLSALEDHRAVLLSSFDHDFALAAANQIVRSSRFDSCQRRLLTLVGEKAERRDINMDLFSREEYDKQHQVILIEVNRKGPFLESLRTPSRGQAGILIDTLETKKLTLICASSNEILGISPDVDLPYCFAFYHYSIPFLSHKLRMHFLEAEAIAIQEQLEDQRNRGLWDDAPGVDDFFRKVSSYLGIRGRLQEELQRRESLSHGLVTCAPIEQLKKIKPADLFKDTDALQGTLLYAGVYFAGLPVRDFEKVVCLLLGETTVEIEEKSRVGHDQGEIQVPEAPVKRKLVDLWRESPDRTLTECSLEIIRGNGSSRVIDFSEGYLRTELREHFEARYPMFLAKRFERFQETGLLFQEDVSEGIADRLISLVVERALFDSFLYDGDWLIRFVFRSAWQQGSPGTYDGPEEDLFGLIARLGEVGRLNGRFFSRLSQLIRELVQHESLRSTVQAFMSHLFGDRQRSRALEIALELAKRLHFVPEFESFFWMKRLLNEGSKAVRDQTYQQLFTLATEKGRHIYELLDAVWVWLPEPTQTTYSKSNLCALRFLPGYCFATTSSPTLERHYGDWPSRYVLFSALPRSITAVRTKLDLLAGWLTHPGLNAAVELEREDPEERLTTGLKTTVELEGVDPEESLAKAIADLIELWILILEGTAPESTAHPEARRIANALLETFATHVGGPQRSHLLRRWQWRQKAYHQEVGELPVSDREGRSKLLAKRKKVLEIHQRFMRLGPSSRNISGGRI